jgi:hypothetical protein
MTRLAGVNLGFAALVFSLGCGAVAWAVESTDPTSLQGPMNTAINDANAATKAAQDNTPNATIKPKEDKLDTTARQNADTSANAPNKPTTDKAEKDAQTDADNVGNTFGNPKNAQEYRKALKLRREARAKLQTLCQQLVQMLQVRRGSLRNDNTDLESMLRKCRATLASTEAVVTVAVRTNNGLENYGARQLPANPPRQENVVAPRLPSNGPTQCADDPVCAQDVLRRGGRDGGPQDGRGEIPGLGAQPYGRGEIPGAGSSRTEFRVGTAGATQTETRRV